MYRRFSRRTGRRNGLGTVVQSFKKVLNHTPASLSTAAQQYDLVVGVDSVAAGQTSSVDANVPTGSVIKSITIWWCQQNLANVAAFTHVTISQLRSGQSAISPTGVGGNTQRNQVHHQDMFCVGFNQNVNRKMIIKIPKKFQRVREGDKWRLSTITDQVSTGGMMCLYKFYR